MVLRQPSVCSLCVILNLFQDLSAEKDKKRLAVRC